MTNLTIPEALVEIRLGLLPYLSDIRSRVEECEPGYYVEVTPRDGEAPILQVFPSGVAPEKYRARIAKSQGLVLVKGDPPMLTGVIRLEQCAEKIRRDLEALLTLPAFRAP